MGFGQSTANEFTTETHPHPKRSTAQLASCLEICGTKLRFANSHKSPLEGEGVLNTVHLAKNSITESSLQNSHISAILCLFDVQNESR